MVIWVRCTEEGGDPVFINLSTAMSVFWNENQKCTFIAYAGSEEDVTRVQERPEAVLAAGGINFGTAAPKSWTST